MGILPTMAFVVKRGSGRWEIRESASTPDGPRSRTLATFEALTPAVLEAAQVRANQPFEVDELANKAARAGAPVQLSRADRLARQLLAELSNDRRPSRGLAAELRESLAEGSHRPEPAVWVSETDQLRGRTLAELMDLTDVLPGEWKPGGLKMPTLRRSP